MKRLLVLAFVSCFVLVGCIIYPPGDHYAAGHRVMGINQGLSTQELNAAVGLHARWVRHGEDFGWPNALKNMRTGISAAHARNLKVLALVHPSNHLYPATTTDLNNLSSYAVQLAQSGADAVEILNEANNPDFVGTPDYTKWAYDHYVISKNVKAASPATIVVSSGLSPYGSPGDATNPLTFTQNAITWSGSHSFRMFKYTDVFGLHTYANPFRVDDPATWNNLNQAQQMSDLTKLPLGITEFGTPLLPLTGCCAISPPTETAQAQWLTDYMNRFDSLPVWIPFYFTLTNCTAGTASGTAETTMGLLRCDYTAKPNGVVFANNAA